LTIDRGRKRFQLRPFESATRFEGMTIIEPTPGAPIRQYQPNLTDQFTLNGYDTRFKPGFVSQALELKRLCDGRGRTVGATMEDATAAVEMAEAVTALNRELS
jgi:hypothetical protein